MEKKLEEFDKLRDKKIMEVEKRRDEHLNEIRDELLETVEQSIRKNIQHIKSSPETLEKIRQLEETNKQQSKKMNTMACQVSEMYEIFTSFGWVGKTVVKVFGAIGIVAGAIIGVIELCKRARQIDKTLKSC